MAGVLARLSWLGIAREPAPGIATLPTAAVPVDANGYEPEDTIGFLLDTGLRSSMGQVAGAVQGTIGSAFAFSAPLFPDSGGWWLDNLLGDLSTVPTGISLVSSSLAAPVNAGDTQLSAATSLGTVPVGSAVQIGDGAASEVVIATAGSTGLVVKFAGTPCRFAHTPAATVSLPSGTPTFYTHTFSALNSGTGQPPCHTLTDTTGLTAGTGARCYPYACVTQIDLAGDPGKGWVTGKVSGVAALSQPSAATVPRPSGAYVAPLAGWQATVLVSGSVAFGGAWTASLKRETVIYRSAGNPQSPVFIARGPLTATGALAYPDPSDETPLSQMLNGGLLPLQIAITNGITGSGALSAALNCQATQFSRAKPDRERIALAYATAWQATDNSVNAGGSGGISPVSVQLVNSQATY